MVLEAVGGGAAGSWALANLAPRVLRGDVGPGFFIEHFVKDLRIALDEARRLGLDLPMLRMAEQTYAALANNGHSRSGTQALVAAYGWTFSASAAAPTSAAAGTPMAARTSASTPPRKPIS